MKLAWASLCALVMVVAHPAVTLAQYQERWSANVSLGSTSLSPGNLGDIDGDGLQDLVVNVNQGGLWHAQVRNLLTGAVQFTSTTGSSGLSGWAFYIMNIDNNYLDQEILASDGSNVMVIDYVGTVSAPANVAPVVRETLLPARPNPFGSQVSMSYSLAAPGRAELEIYDVAGRLLRRLGGERMEAGEHRVDWDGRDQEGRSLDPGMYFYRLNVDGRTSEARRAVRLGQ
jgi:hypothetical protein